MPREESSTQQLIRNRIAMGSGGLDKVVYVNRAAGWSWEAIAGLVWELSGVRVSRDSLRRWYPQLVGVHGARRTH